MVMVEDVAADYRQKLKCLRLIALMVNGNMIIETKNGEDTNVLSTEKGRISRVVTGLETNAKTFIMDKSGTENLVKTAAINKVNDQIDEYREKLEEHNKFLEEQVNRLSDNFEKIEIKPLGNYVLATQFSQNPFQKIKTDSKSGLIIDTGGLAPMYKSHETGEEEAEKPYIQVGTVVEVGPEVKYLKVGDAIMWTAPTGLDIPFYKQGLVTICEFNVKAVISEGLQERFDNIKK